MTKRAQPPLARRVGMALALVATGVAMAGVSIETFLRVTAYHQVFAQPDADVGYVLTPRFSRVVPVLEHAGGSAVFRTNNLGLRRDSDIPLVKPAETRRILVLGDSQTEGIVSNEESYCAHLERALNEPSPRNGTSARRVEVLNAGVSGYSPLLEYLWFRDYGRQLQPDVVLLALYAGNDIGELLMHHEDFGGLGPIFILPFLRYSAGEWQVVPPGDESGLMGRWDWLLQTYLRSYAAVRRTLRPLTRLAPQDGLLQRVTKRCPGCLQALWQPFIAHGDVTALNEAFARLNYLLLQFQHDVDEMHASLMVTVIPTKLEAEDLQSSALVQEMIDTLALQYDAAAFDAGVRARIVALAEEHGIATVDLLPALRQWHRQHRQPLYWDFDWHLNVVGHQIVAQQLLPALATALHPAPAGN